METINKGIKKPLEHKKALKFSSKGLVGRPKHAIIELISLQ
jgi:hypothetical protein